MSPRCVDVLEGLLTKDPSKRLGCAHAAAAAADARARLKGEGGRNSAAGGGGGGGGGGGRGLKKSSGVDAGNRPSLLRQALVGTRDDTGDDLDSTSSSSSSSSSSSRYRDERGTVTGVMFLTNGHTIEVECGRDAGAEEIKAHPFFDGIDWKAMLRGEVPPPWTPVRKMQERDREREMEKREKREKRD